MKYLSYVARLLSLKTLDLSTPGRSRWILLEALGCFLQEDCFMSIIYTTEG